MFSIFISTSSLLNLLNEERNYRREDWSDWNAILHKQNVVLTERDIQNDFPYSSFADVPDPSVLSLEEINAAMLLSMGQAYGFQCLKSDIDYNQSVQSDFYVDDLTRNSHLVYLLDISEERAETIQTRCGVICQSTHNLQNSILALPINYFSTISNERHEDWEDLFNQSIPLNSLVILDRYLFSIDDKKQLGASEAIENLKQIIEAVLPETLDCSFHILIVFSDNPKVNPDPLLSLYDVTDEIETTINDMGLPYTVELEFLSLNNGQIPEFDETHNRKLISNYWVASVEESFKAFDSNKVGIYSQDINIKTLYANGLRQNRTSPIIYHQKLIEVLTNIVNYSQTALSMRKNHIRMYSNRNYQPTSTIVNRMIH